MAKRPARWMIVGAGLTLLTCVALEYGRREYTPAVTSPTPRVDTRVSGRLLFAAVPRPDEQDSNDCVAGDAIASLHVREVRADEETVYVDLDHSAAAEVELPIDSQRPRVFLSLDGCRVGEYTPDEEVAARTQNAATVSVPLRVVPDGDVTLDILALGATTTLHFRKVGVEIASISAMERSHIRYFRDPDSPDDRLFPAELVRDCPKVTPKEVLR